MSDVNHRHVSEHQHDFSRGLGRVFYWVMALNMVYVIVEGGFGFATGSMGLLSDAGHNLTDVATLALSFVAFKAAGMAANKRYTYGYGKATVEAAFINAVTLYVIVAVILIESIRKFAHPKAIDGDTIAWVAGIGVAINGITTWLLLKYSHDDLNIKGAFFHMLSDTLVSAGVVIAGIVIHYTGWYIIDPIIGVCIALLIGVTSYSLLRDSLHMILDGVPKGIDIDMVRRAILSVPGVASMHHLHVWPMSTTKTALTVHVILKSPDSIDRTIDDVRRAVEACGITHSTIEAETRIGPHELLESESEPTVNE